MVQLNISRYGCGSSHGRGIAEKRLAEPASEVSVYLAAKPCYLLHLPPKNRPCEMAWLVA